MPFYFYGIPLSVSQKKDSFNKLRSNLLTRGLSLAKAGIRAGSMALNKGDVTAQMAILVGELGKLKGTAMKVGQSLSMYGEHLLPKEVNDLLKNLQQASPPLAWPSVREVLVRELGEEKLKELQIEETSVAAASIGQVHRARLGDQTLAMKIQYPGVDQAVATDLKLLKFILNLSEIVPRGPRFDQIFAEIRDMFEQEINYDFEKQASERFATLLGGDDRYVIPKVHARHSTRKVLALDFIDGKRADHPEVQGLSQERRNRIGLLFLELYLKELLLFNVVQTDPHLGNYMIQIDPAGENDRLVLLDFGAVREVPADFLASYRIMMRGSVERNPRLAEKGGLQLGLLQAGDSPELTRDFLELCFLLTEPFQGVYDWGHSDLPQRVASRVAKIATTYRLRAPPRELVFLDRKLGGVFIFLSVLKCKFDARDLVMRILAETDARAGD